MKTNQIILNCLAIQAANERDEHRRAQSETFSQYLSVSQLDALLAYDHQTRRNEITDMFSIETD
jgi:hypothetical protein